MKRPNKYKYPDDQFPYCDVYIASDIDPLLDELEQMNLTLRDQFAMAALNKLISDNDGLRPDVIANLAYTIADQMLEARK